MTTRIEPTTTFADTTAAILDYLVQRTSDTAGKTVARSEAAVIGEVEKSEGRTVEDFFLVQTRLRVDEWLAGSGSSVIDIVHAPEKDAIPPFSIHDRGLLFLRSHPHDVPYAAHVPANAYAIVPGTIGSWTAIREVVDAVRWYAALPPDGPARHDALLRALSDDRPRIVHHAVRELAETRGGDAAPHIQNSLGNTHGVSRTILILGLWLTGQKDAAAEAFEAELRPGKDAWLERWGVRASQTDRGERTGTLFGPAGGNPWSIE
jgi:hypothetical protein